MTAAAPAAYYGHGDRFRWPVRQMHIERIQLRDIGPFDDVTIEFPPGKDPDLADVYLLTGPNGSGKSTVLYALAAVIAGEFEQLGDELLTRRIRSKNAMVALRSLDGRTFAAAYSDLMISMFGIPPPFDGTQLFDRGASKGLHLFDNEPDGRVSRYSKVASTFRPGEISSSYDSINWAAFAYAGLRPMSDVHITAIQEPKGNPFENSLSFLKTANTNLLANWIVSQNYRRLKLKEAGDIKGAEQLDQSVRRIEKIIGKIIEDPTFAFVITAKDDDDVRARWRGVTVRLEVLPDGLQSIVSWVADLLMRLDRIPWQDNTSVELRRFLLLLDEIDIHLHPAWQRRVLPLVQRWFPNAQIIASPHSPFVVGSLADGRIISLGLQGGSAKVVHENEPQLGVSYSAVLRSIFGIESEFDIDTERRLHEFHAARLDLLKGDPTAQAKLDGIAKDLADRSEELREIIALELRQLQRQLALRAAP